MKKLFYLFILLFLGLGLTACGTNSTKSDSQLKKTVYMSDDSGETTSQITIYSDGDNVIKQITQNILYFKKLGYNVDDAKKAMDSQNAKYKKKINGYKYDVKYDTEKATETISVDFRKFDFDKGKDILETEGNPKKGVSLKTTKKMLEAAGFKEIKK